jgi:hypothetical protein
MAASQGRNDMATGSYKGEQIVAEFSADMDRHDYGEQGGEAWDEAVSITLDALTILGVAVPVAGLKSFYNPLYQAVMALADEVEFE